MPIENRSRKYYYIATKLKELLICLQKKKLKKLKK